MNVIPIDPGRAQALEAARATLSAMHPTAREIALSMVRPQLGTPGEAEFAAEVAKSLVEFGMPADNVEAFVTAAFELARG